jgi:hypothetical protein
VSQSSRSNTRTDPYATPPNAFEETRCFAKNPFAV